MDGPIDQSDYRARVVALARHLHALPEADRLKQLRLLQNGDRKLHAQVLAELADMPDTIEDDDP